MKKILLFILFIFLVKIICAETAQVLDINVTLAKPVYYYENGKIITTDTSYIGKGFKIEKDVNNSGRGNRVINGKSWIFPPEALISREIVYVTVTVDTAGKPIDTTK